MAKADPPDDASELDVREVEGEPFSHITDALDDLDRGESLVLVNDFEPVPLYEVLDDRGFEHDAECVGEDEWRIHVRRPT